MKSKLTIVKKKLTEEDHKKIDKNFELKFLTPPKISASLKVIDKNRSNSPPRFRNYDNFTKLSSNSSLNPNIVSFPYFRQISITKLQPLRATFLSSPSPKPKNSLRPSPTPPISIYQRHSKLPKISLNASKNLVSISPTRSQRSLPLPPTQKISIKKKKINPDLSRKARSSIKHYKLLSFEVYSKSKIWEFFPGVPYGLENSKDFLKACKMGNYNLAQNYLAVNPWLAHTFDYSRISAIHWSVIRGHLKIVQLLLTYKVWVDIGDFAGRTPIFLAAKYSKVRIFQYLLTNGADPFIKTRAYTSAIQVAKDEQILKILNLYKTKLYFKTWILNKTNT